MYDTIYMLEKMLNKRQEELLAFIEKRGGTVAVADVVNSADNFGSVARITTVRDLGLLAKLGYLEKQGKGRGVTYCLSGQYLLVRPIKVEEYFKVGPDARQIKNTFNFGIFTLFKNIFSDEELRNLEKLNLLYKKNIKNSSPAIFKRECERLIIEFSWKSSQIEGNTYTLLETEYLLKEHKEPKGHSHEETTMVLNHKSALDYIFANTNKFKKLSLAKIEDVHYLLIKGTGVERNLRKRMVRVSGTNYLPLDNPHQIREAVEKAVKLINTQKNVFTKALGAMLIISYIQPFEDGNKRTSRLIGNALLLAYGASPLSFRSIDELEYKKAILLFYEQNNLQYFKELFIKQFEFAVKNYFG